jgi:hypothetical protein
MTTKPDAPVSRSALISRIRRHISAKGWRLVHARSAQMASNFGEIYIMDVRRNCVVEPRIDLEKYGRELGVLHGWEHLETKPT